MPVDKKAFDITGGNPVNQENLKRTSENQTTFARGIAGHPLLESIPQVIKTSTEKHIENGNNAFIVLGRDRPASRLSGYGGAGHTGAGSVDIVVGRMGYKAKEFADNGTRFWVDPSFKDDAARIYLSQKTDIDDNFGLADGRVGNSKTKSAIGLKADGIRIVAREGIKLVTRTDDNNSQGGSVDSTSGIDLIAGNDDSDIQPMVKGRNLQEALKTLTMHVDKLNGIVDSLLMYQMTFNTALTHHVHFSPFFGLPTSPSPPVMAAGMQTQLNHLMQTKMSLIMNKANLAMFKHSYLYQSGNKFINSRYCNLT